MHRHREAAAASRRVLAWGSQPPAASQPRPFWQQPAEALLACKPACFAGTRTPDLCVLENQRLPCISSQSLRSFRRASTLCMPPRVGLDLQENTEISREWDMYMGGSCLIPGVFHRYVPGWVPTCSVSHSGSPTSVFIPVFICMVFGLFRPRKLTSCF